ncbi:feruloyl-CoA synthase [Marinospirillum sp.]|uniref:feruloyl-CoA synthase n=1 Tax=Marinospirillum sp. TaxID=2183934 RepID=UPI00287042B2|nr:feruloyl-CoA synthase [Marinospirillum sp.]MDR9467892.1 feruloyl-CoA synthase [Marinospirillum sp.]
MTNTANAPFLENNWEPARVQLDIRDNGEQIASSPYELERVATSIVELLQNAVARYPERTFLAQRDAQDQWVKLDYLSADRRSSAVAQWLLNLKLTEQTPVMILSENSLEHALFMLGAMKARIPVVPVSPGYSLFSKDFIKLRKIFSEVQPGVVFVQNVDQYQAALDALDLTGVRLVGVTGHTDWPRLSAFSEVEATQVTREVEASIAAIAPETPAKILYTSGSTGEPKGVLNTHGNLCYIQSAMAAVVHIDLDRIQPTILDWLPWHHTYGGNQNFNRTLKYCGALYIDDGKPLPGLFQRTLRNLREVPITTFSTVPLVYNSLLDALEKDDKLRKNFFKHLEWLSYGGSDMPQVIFERIQKIAAQEIGKRVPVITAMGSTETSAVTTCIHWHNERMGNIGLPAPGTTLKLLPLGGKYEMRVRGPQVTRGYFKNPEKTQEAFDDEGFFKTGDAVRWLDENKPELGLMFAGRIAEDFKLLNGTWVHTGALRSQLVSTLGSLVTDMVITGQDKDYIGLLVWPNEDGIKARFPEMAERPLTEVIASDAYRQALQACLQKHNQQNDHTSSRVKRLLVLLEPPSLDHNEITDKRYINQGAVLERRAAEVDKLYTQQPGNEVLIIDQCP